MVVEHRRAQLARERQQLLHRLARQPLGLGQLAAQLRRRALDRRLEPQRDGGQRLVDLVVEVLRDPPPLPLLGLDRGAAGLAALALEPRDHPVERALEPPHLGAVGCAGAAAARSVGRPGRSCSIARDQLLERLEPPAQQQPVAEQRRDQREPQHQAFAAVTGPCERWRRRRSSRRSTVAATSSRLTIRTWVSSERDFMALRPSSWVGGLARSQDGVLARYRPDRAEADNPRAALQIFRQET